MKKIVTFLFFFSFMTCSYVNAADVNVSEMCQKKNSDLTCSDLNYTETDISNGNDITCTPCPIYKENKYSCAQKNATTIAYSNTSVTTVRRGAYACDQIPSCSQMGYQISKENVKKIPSSFSCSACPFDGNYWACVGGGSLVKVP